MKKRILFVAGVYGVGKTTLCDILSEKYLISSYSSSELISKCNHEEYIKLLLKCEEEQAEKVSNLYKIPLLKYNMQFNNNDAKNVIELLKHIGG